MSALHSPQQNYLLASLPAEVYERLLPDLALVPMPLGHVVYASGAELPYLYFPTSCILHRWRKPPSAIDITRWINNCVDGCY